MTPALLLSVLLLSSPAARVRPGGASLEKAQSEFSRGDFPAALKSLQVAKSDGADEDTLGQVELLEGQIRAAQRDLSGAEEAFARALEHDPDGRLDPDKVDPDLVRVLDSLRERLKGELRVMTDGPARVLVDGRPVGNAPVKATLGIGQHTVEAWSPDGRRGASGVMVVRHNRTTQAELALTESGAAQLVDGGGLRPFADVRAGVNLFHSLSDLATFEAFEVGGGVELQSFRLSLHASVYPTFGLTPRGALTVPIAEPARLYMSLELPTMFFNSVSEPLAFGMGGAIGAELFFNRWISAFAEAGGRHFFVNPVRYEPNRFLGQGGFRLRVP